MTAIIVVLGIQSLELIYGMNGANEFPARATLGGLLTWPMGPAHVAASFWGELAGGACALGAHLSSDGMVPCASTRTGLLCRSV